jgi:mono/diheme cytochrome c family protein
VKRALLVIGALVVVALLVAAILVVPTMRSGLSTHADAPRIEVMLAQMLRRWSVPSELRDAKNPMPLTPEALADGRAHFADHCAVCHGNDGKGSSGMGRMMYPRTPDMTLAETQSQSDGALFATIENGVRLSGMPGFGTGTAESARGSWALVHFIRHLPKLTPEEIAEMEKLNPKSPAEWQAMQDEEAFLKGGDTSAAPPPPQGHHH